MTLRFTGNYEELRERLSGLSGTGDWFDLNENQKQFRHKNGGILNWFPSTGTINFQGKEDVRSSLEAEVSSELASDAVAAEPAEAVRPKPAAATPAVAKPAAAQATGAKPAGAVAEHVVADRQDPLSRSPGSVGNRGQTKTTVRIAATEQSVACPIDREFLGQRFVNSELVIGLVGAVGTELKLVIDILESRLKVLGYTTTQVRVSNDIIPQVVPSAGRAFADEFERINGMMDAGDEAREQTGDNSVLALGVAAKISSDRPRDGQQPKPRLRHAYIINSLKHPDEVARLREIYPEGFYLVGVHADQKRRAHYLTENKRLSQEQAEKLMLRDEDEHISYGQRTSDTFHLSDFFVRIDGHQDRLEKSLWRILDVLFGHPYVTPTFDEYAMFMAFAAALRSADLSRQVGAVVTHNREIVATGANDCPKFGGGLYWPEYDQESHEIRDAKDGRDYMRGEDANRAEQQKIIEDILSRVGASGDRDKLKKAMEESRIGDITEYGRMVHAEMEALMSCARSNVSARGATLYCTTFPCHNCAKHIVAAGIVRVVYVEPYPKSKAAEFHSDSISLGFSEADGTVHFEPFVGVGPRRFFDLFSLRLGSGYPIRRKGSEGQVVEWKPENAKLRTQMLPCSYVELEIVASSMFNGFRKQKESNGNAK